MERQESDNVGHGLRELEARAWEGDEDAIDTLLAMTGAPGQARRAAMQHRAAAADEQQHVDEDSSNVDRED
jgi:hypothetical protein